MKNYLIAILTLLLLTACTPPSNDYRPSSPSFYPQQSPFVSVIPVNYQNVSMAGMLAVHNQVRAAVGVPPLRWSEPLARYSKDWAGHLAFRRGCQMIHRQEAGKDYRQYGENLYWASPEDSSFGHQGVQPVVAPQVAIAWAEEKPDYHYGSNRCRSGKQCGHYTQMVWRNTQHVGCGMSICPNLGQIWVCSYDPPGNWVGERPY